MYKNSKNMSDKAEMEKQLEKVIGGKGIVLFNIECKKCGCAKTFTRKPSEFLCERCGSSGFECKEYPLHPAF